MKVKATSMQAGARMLVFATSLLFGTIDARSQSDFGDAPAEIYPTLVADNGARHVAIGPLLGTERDAEADGNSSLDASGDDTDGTPDDEDGVVFTSVILPGEFATVSVTTSGTGPYILNAWIDFNSDGDWLDPGEQIFTNTNLALGQNDIQFPVPAAARLGGQTYSRWRLNTTGGLLPAGSAFDGEVEDYCIGSIAGRKWYDRNEDGVQDSDEPGLNGWSIHLYDETGTTLITTVETGDVDEDENGLIDRITERGRYLLGGVAADTYVIREEPHPIAFQTSPAGGEYDIDVDEGEIVEDLDFGNAGITIRPDLKIGRRLGVPFFDDVYYPVIQRLRCRGKMSRRVKTFVIVENDGDVTDVIAGFAKRPPQRKFRIAFTEFQRGNVTALLRRGALQTQLDPGEFRVFTAVAIAKNRRSSRKNILRNWVQATSLTDPVFDRIYKFGKLRGSR